jgi:ADP-ribose pyrophosphatase YjhB (NUDIX family)
MNMVINSTFKHKGQDILVKYYDLDSFDSLDYSKCQQVYGVCFYKDQLVIVHGEGMNHGWGLVGGHIENNENFDQTLAREVQEETNMRVLQSFPVGVQEVTDPDGNTIYQLRYLAIVEPLGEFVSDPAGSVTEIKLIDPMDYKKYFDWGEIGDRIIERAIEIKNQFSSINI